MEVSEVMSNEFELVDALDDVQERRPSFLAIGVFDGVHLGHQQLLQKMVAEAAAAGTRAAALTFFPHPEEVILGLTGRLYLTTLERRVSLLANLGMELIIVHPFDEAVRNTRAATFVERLCQSLDLKQLWGGSFSLGYKREGTAGYLAEIGREKGFSVHEVNDLVTWRGKAVSSSRIRKALELGDIAEANGCLGRRFSIAGEVNHGDRRGRSIGFPTANLAIWEKQILPAHGVYAAYAYLNGQRFLAATNIGVRPTFARPALSVEAHLLDFSGEIYGEMVDLEFVARIREERKFPGVEALKEQIAADVAAARTLLDP